jgi:outer membrane lipoprotein-sorting protein
MLLLGLTGAVLAHVPASYADEARDLMQKVLEGVPKVPFSAKIKLTSDRGWERSVTILRAHQEDMEKIYLEVSAPNDMKDTRFLLFDRLNGKDEQWMYVPAMKRSVQLNNQTRKQEFLGSDFAVADLVRPELDAYAYKLVGEETLEGRVCQLVESLPKNAADEIYSKSIIAVDPKDLLIVRTLLFGSDNRPLKSWTIDKYEKKDGYWTPLDQRMVNLQNNRWSRIELLDVKYNAELPSDAFNKSYLTR